MKHVKPFEKLFENANTNVSLSVDVRGPADAHILFAVIIVDDEDSEDSQVEFWRANDENQLQDLMREVYAGDDESDDYENGLRQMFDDDWGMKILATEIGRI